jgi:hypothetical protein
MVKDTKLAAKEAGFPLSHAHCFQQVANQLNCMIASRAVGIYATGLIEENYASKGYHVKTKSCNWGPMAGFVLSDPRFSKKGIAGIVSQRRATTKALSEGATEIPVYISDVRRKELERRVWMSFVGAGSNINNRHYTANSSGGYIMRFTLQRTMSAPGANGMQMWAVCYALDERSMQSSIWAPNLATSADSLLPVMALVDPQCSPALRRSYRSAMTGDYDLWGIWPSASEYSPRGLDKRPVPQSDFRPLSYEVFEKHEDKHLGNITQRGIKVNNLLNAAIKSAGYAGGNMVHHSDETGRPQVFDVEMDFIAFVPNEDGCARFVETMSDYQALIRHCVGKYSISLNGAWQGALGFGATNAGHREWP